MLLDPRICLYFLKLRQGQDMPCQGLEFFSQTPQHLLFRFRSRDWPTTPRVLRLCRSVVPLLSALFTPAFETPAVKPRLIPPPPIAISSPSNSASLKVLSQWPLYSVLTSPKTCPTSR